LPEKIGAELLVRQNLPDNQLHGSVRHDSHTRSRVPLFGAPFSGSPPSRPSAEQGGCRRRFCEKTAQIR
jgi:hypothetical protein